jgi:hypothetical protein
MRRNIDYNGSPNKDEKFWLNLVTWGKCYGVKYMGGRQISESPQEIREEDNKLNKQVIAKLLVQMSLLVLY